MSRFSDYFISSLLVIASSAVNAGLLKKLINPVTGTFDISDGLLEHYGILPIPIIISDPAVGYSLEVTGT
jgi:hypothetical protein